MPLGRELANEDAPEKGIMMRVWLAMVAFRVGLALTAMPVGHAFAPQSNHAAHLQSDQPVEKAASAAAAICCPVPNLPAVGVIAHPVSVSPVSWNRPVEIVSSGEFLAPEPPPPRL